MKNIFKLSLAVFLVVGLVVPSTVNAATKGETDEEGHIVDEGQTNGGIYENSKEKRNSQIMSEQYYKKRSIEESLNNGRLPQRITRASPDNGYRILNVPHKTQENNYYCGPASLQMVLSYKGKNVSQKTLAARLGTTVNGTPAGDNVANALNYYLGRVYGWSWHNYNDVAGVKNKFYAGMAAGDPSVVNTAESEGDCYIVGHFQFKSIYHFGVVDGLTTVDTVRYNDPGAGYFDGMTARQMLPVWKMSYAMGGRGLAW